MLGRGGDGQVQYMKVTGSQPRMTDATIPWGTSSSSGKSLMLHKILRVTNILWKKKSQNFMLRPSIRQKSGRLSKFRKQRKQNKTEALMLQNHGEGLDLP